LGTASRPFADGPKGSIPDLYVRRVADWVLWTDPPVPHKTAPREGDGGDARPLQLDV